MKGLDGTVKASEIATYNGGKIATLTFPTVVAGYTYTITTDRATYTVPDRNNQSDQEVA